MNRLRFSALLLSLSLILPMSANAAADLFPDVSAGSLYKTEIEALVKAGVIHGNPDGTFHPNDEVTRAALLKLAYLAAKKTPAVAKAKCAGDVDLFQWYTDIVCDAMATGFVQGVGGGKFAPGRAVTRAEGLKMIMEVMGKKPVADPGDKNLVKFTDVAGTSWYFGYVATALRQGILPIAGQTGDTRFFPDKTLLRAEAAAYIYNALKLNGQTSAPASSVSSVASSVSSSVATSVAADEPVAKAKTFPFTDAGQFTKKKSVSYLFDISADSVVAVKADISGAVTSGITCRLYVLDADGFSYEYYLGMSDGASCVMNAAVKPGKYQLQIQPTADNAYFDLSVKAGTSDGNDGFREAKVLNGSMLRADVLSPNDIADWFSFTVGGTAATQGTVEVSSSSPLSCIIYSAKNVDQFGFTGPECNKSYLFQPGQYIVGVARKSGSAAKQMTYSIRWK